MSNLTLIEELIKIRMELREKKEYVLADRLRVVIEKIYNVKILDNKCSVSILTKTDSFTESEN